MAAPIRTTDHNSLLTRRRIVIGAAVSLICAPAIMRVTPLMPVRRLPFPFGLSMQASSNVYICTRSNATYKRLCAQVERT
jgi:hypothetical protein